jgi:hypothetical protein
MNEKDIANKIRQHLNFGLSRIDPTVEKQLASARASALAAYAHTEQAHGYVLAGVGGGHVHHHHHFHWPLRYWLPVALVILALAGALYWQSSTTKSTDEDVDASLLASDLPVTAYLDKGFAQWLDQHSSQP